MLVQNNTYVVYPRQKRESPLELGLGPSKLD